MALAMSKLGSRDMMASSAMKEEEEVSVDEMIMMSMLQARRISRLRKSSTPLLLILTEFSSAQTMNPIVTLEEKHDVALFIVPRLLLLLFSLLIAFDISNSGCVRK